MANLAQTMNVKSEVQDWLNANHQINLTGSAGASQLKMENGIHQMPSATYMPGASAVNSGDQIKSFGRRAYVSPIQLRRMTRSMPDLEARIKLRELTEKLNKSKSDSLNQPDNGTSGNGTSGDRCSGQSHGEEGSCKNSGGDRFKSKSDEHVSKTR
jgi:hypothetical protein